MTQDSGLDTMQLKNLTSALLLALPAGALAAQSADLAVGGRISTLGFGVEVSKLITPNLAVRVGANKLNYSTTRTESDVTFDADLELESFSAVVDIYLSKRGSFHLTGGLMTDPGELSGVGRPSESTFEINGVDYDAADVGVLTASGTWKSTLPYVGIGWGTPASSGGGISFAFDIGAALGKPTLALSASAATANSQLAADVAAERDSIQDDIEKYFAVYPVISLGLRVRF
jgi:hypothetical protein